MATPTLPENLPKWLVDILLIGIGASLVVFGVVQGGRFGDGETVGGGLLMIGAGGRGLISAS